MVPVPDIIRGILVSGGAVRIHASGLIPQVMQEYAACAHEGGAHITFVMGQDTLAPELMNAIASIGTGHVTFDFAAVNGAEK
jgi:hypothetical protein